LSVHIRLLIGVTSKAVAELSDASCASFRNLHVSPTNNGGTSSATSIAQNGRPLRVDAVEKVLVIIAES
jgi:hypothetical protein